MDEQPYSPLFHMMLLVGIIGIIGFFLTAAVFGVGG